MCHRLHNQENNTQCSEGCQCTNCLNMPKTEGREDIDLVEIALEEEVTIDSTQLDTDELLKWVFGAENENNVNMSDFHYMCGGHHKCRGHHKCGRHYNCGHPANK